MPMPRTGRAVLPGYPHHIVQRGHNRQAVFAEPDDYRRYLDSLCEFKREYGVEVHAYCLMTNHVHLLLTPRDGTGIARLMKRLAGRQTRRHNRLEGRTGTLWEGRYKSSPVDTDSHLLACCRYIELNPVRAHILVEPETYPWSSCGARLGSGRCDWLDLDPAYLSLGFDEAERRVEYRHFLRSAIPEGEWTLIRESVQRGQLTGATGFALEVESIVGRRIERRGRGRPKKSENKSVPF